MKVVQRSVRKLDVWWDRASPKRRLDSNLGNIFLLLGLVVFGFSLLALGPAKGTSLAAFPRFFVSAMAVAIIIGCGLKLHGALAGRRFYFPNVKLKKCYAFGVSGGPSASIGAAAYGAIIIQGNSDFLSTTAIPFILFSIGVSAQSSVYWLETRRIKRNEKALTEIYKGDENHS